MRFLLAILGFLLAANVQAAELPVAQSPQYDVFLDTDRLMIDTRDPQHLDTYQFIIRIMFKQPQGAGGVQVDRAIVAAQGRCSTLETAEMTSIMYSGAREVASTPAVQPQDLNFVRLDPSNPGTHTLSEICRTIEMPCAQYRGTDGYNRCRTDAVLKLRQVSMGALSGATAPRQ